MSLFDIVFISKINMDKKNLTQQPNELTAEQYNFLFNNNKNQPINAELANPFPVQGYNVQPQKHIYNRRDLLVSGMITRLPSNTVRQREWYKMNLMIPINTEHVIIKWTDGPLIIPPLQLAQQTVTLQSTMITENGIRTITIINPYDVGMITTTFTTSKCSYDQQFDKVEPYSPTRDYHSRDPRYRDYNRGYNQNYSYGYDNKKRRYDEK